MQMQLQETFDDERECNSKTSFNRSMRILFCIRLDPKRNISEFSKCFVDVSAKVNFFMGTGSLLQR